LLLAACATELPSPPSASSIDAAYVLAPTGTLRIGVYQGSPTSMLRNATTGETRGITVEVGQALARRLGVGYALVEYARIAEVIQGIKNADADFTVGNASVARARDVDFTPPLLAIELGYLVRSGSPIASLADVDRSGIRIGVTQGSTSLTTLPGILKHATLVPVPTVTDGARMLRQQELDAFATNKAILGEMSDNVPGSRMLEGRWGVEHLAIAIPKGREAGMTYLRAFVDDVTRAGLVVRAGERAGLRGMARD
jgi:polar amino acid transport system substrate-binding protein